MEYAIILVLVSVVVVLVLITQGQTLYRTFSNVSCGLSQCSQAQRPGDGDHGDHGG